MRELLLEELSSIQRDALHEAELATRLSYSPYSNFAVGACLYAQGRKLVSGANFENAVYGATICAERAAVVRANAMGMRQFSGIVIIARGAYHDTAKEVTAPCGSCRQVLHEVSQISSCNLEVILSNFQKDIIFCTSVEELLPLAFGPRELGVDIRPFQK